MSAHKWASTHENLSSVVCQQQRRRPACPSPKTDQCLCYSLFLERTISKLASSKISMFWLASVAVETGLSLVSTETPIPGFVAMRPILLNALNKLRQRDQM